MGLLLIESVCFVNWLTIMHFVGLRILQLLAFARRFHGRLGVASGRAIRMDLNSADVALRVLLRVHSTCCSDGITRNALILLARA